MRFAVGSMVGANLRLARKLGEGGMGSVWVADHLTLETQVAVKFMSETLVKDGEAIARFNKEATAAARVKSRHVVQTLDSGLTGDGIPFIVMELLSGEDLGGRLARVGTLSVHETETLVRQTCKALAQAHAQGIVHRDIKPENIFFTESDGEPVIKILDFGIAKRLGTESFFATSAGALMGTPLYMSPEQIMGSTDVRDASDLWSLGVVAYQALTGKLPFTGETLGSIIVAVNQAVHVAPSRVREDLPQGIDDWMARALAREPAERFASARDMADQLGVALGSARVSVDVLPPRVSETSIPPFYTASRSRLSTHPTFLGAAVTHPDPAPGPRRVPTQVVATGTLLAVVAIVAAMFARSTGSATVMPPLLTASASTVASGSMGPPAPVASPLEPVPVIDVESLPAATTSHERTAEPGPSRPPPAASSAASKPAGGKKKSRGF
jgi:serine/threonine protein kinase